MTQLSLGNALLRLGERAGNTYMLREAAAAYRQALQEQGRQHAPIQWAATQICFGNALFALGARKAVRRSWRKPSPYGKALEVYNFERTPLQWAAIAGNQAVELSHIAERQNDLEMAKLAVNRRSRHFARVRICAPLPTLRHACRQPKPSPRRSPKVGLS
jgi:hypothetical protein